MKIGSTIIHYLGELVSNLNLLWNYTIQLLLYSKPLNIDLFQKIHVQKNTSYHMTIYTRNKFCSKAPAMIYYNVYIKVYALDSHIAIL
jgi:hypothetical protein